MSRLTRDGTRPDPSRETRFSGAKGDNREKFSFPVQLTTRAGLATRTHPVDPYIHIDIHAVHIHINMRSH